MQRLIESVGRRALVPVLAICVASGGADVLRAQTGELPSSPNPSSMTSPFFGSVTREPVTDGVVKLSIDEAVARGLKNNLGLKGPEQDEKTLHGERNEALQGFLPTINVTGSTGYNEYNLAAFGFGPGLFRKVGNLFPGLDPSSIPLITYASVTRGQVEYEQTLFSGQVLDGYKAVGAAVKSAYFAKMSARGEVVQQVATAYLAAVADRSEVENAKALLASDKVLLDQAHEKHVAGVVANLDELRARVQYQQQQQAVTAAQVRLDKAEILLRREIGIAPGQKIELTDAAPYRELAERSLEDLRTDAYANRQDYQNLQAQVRENQMVIGARKAERFPTLSFKGNYGATEVASVGTHGTMAAMGTVSFPIFREASIRGETDAARAQLQSVHLELTDLHDKIDQQLQTAVLDVRTAQRLVDVARSNEGLAKQALEDETDRFKAGVDDTLPLVQAQATLANAQTTLVESLYQFNVTKLQLARATGLLETQYKSYLGN
ncbi:MAG TPA: TolC family protein [Acidobacteriaceae bacterium]|nr:TolC family protein [Acidobacteriaceae bacterium]